MPKVKAIDTHVHVWRIADYRPHSSWFGDKTFLNCDYLPAELESHLTAMNIESALIVGAAPNAHAHNRWCGELIERHDYLAGLIGSYSLEHPQLTRWLDAYAGKNWFLGIRAMPAAPPEQWATDPATARGIAALKRRGLTLDMLVDPDLLPAVASLAAKHPELPIIVNHCGLPPFRTGDLSSWARNMATLAAIPNIVIKYSSFFLYCHPDCKPEQLRQVARVLFENFGAKRLLWGSNWPPELVGGTYRQAFETMLECAGELSDSEYAYVFRENARRVYSLVDD